MHTQQEVAAGDRKWSAAGQSQCGRIIKVSVKKALVSKDFISFITQSKSEDWAGKANKTKTL